MLVEKALAHQGRKPSRDFTPDELDLVVAWLSGEVNMAQVKTALGMAQTGVQVYVWLARGAKAVWQTTNNHQPHKQNRKP